MTERTFDYTPSWDERNKDYPIQALLAPSRRVDRPWRYWWQGQVLDQGAEGACVGFGWTAELMASPDRVKFDEPDTYARNIYREAQVIDEWPGESYEGTSVLAGAKVVQSYGLIGEYRWAFTIEDIIQTLMKFGPVVVGIPWYESMYKTRPSGLVESLSSSSDRMVGGHCLTLTGYSRQKRFRQEGLTQKFEVIRWRNSWGKDYGKSGSGYIRVEDFEKLFRTFGEACVPITRHTPDQKL